MGTRQVVGTTFLVASALGLGACSLGGDAACETALEVDAVILRDVVAEVSDELGPAVPVCDTDTGPPLWADFEEIPPGATLSSVEAAARAGGWAVRAPRIPRASSSWRGGTMVASSGWSWTSTRAGSTPGCQGRVTPREASRDTRPPLVTS